MDKLSKYISHITKRNKPFDVSRHQQAIDGPTAKPDIDTPLSIVHLTQFLFPSLHIKPRSTMQEIVQQAYQLEPAQRDRVLEVIRQIKDQVKPLIEKPLERREVPQEVNSEQAVDMQQGQEEEAIWQELPKKEWYEIKEQNSKEAENTFREVYREKMEAIWNEEEDIWRKKGVKSKNNVLKNHEQLIDTIKEIEYYILLIKHLASVVSGTRHWQSFETEPSAYTSKGSNGSSNDYEDYDPKETRKSIKKFFEEEVRGISGESDPKQIAKMLEHYKTYRQREQMVQQLKTSQTQQFSSIAEEILQLLSKRGKKFSK